MSDNIKDFEFEKVRRKYAPEIKSQIEIAKILVREFIDKFEKAGLTEICGQWGGEMRLFQLSISSEPHALDKDGNVYVPENTNS